jgi:phosphatidylglycerophosphate synthase
MTTASGPAGIAPGRASVAQIRIATKPPEHEFVLARYYGRIISPYLTWICLRVGLSADQVTIVGCLFGAVGAVLLFPVLGPWTAAGVIALQVAYLLDFSDGQVARIRGTSSMAGGYLDWLTHLYVPPAAALAMSASVAIALGQQWPFVLGIAAALELAPMAFQGKEHVLVAMARTDPALGRSAFFFAALNDDARALDVEQAADGAPAPLRAVGVAGRTRRASLRSLVGEVLIYPGAAHLMTFAVFADLASSALGGPSVVCRVVVLTAWTAALLVHLPLVARRNYRVIQAVERRARGRSASETLDR